MPVKEAMSLWRPGIWHALSLFLAHTVRSMTAMLSSFRDAWQMQTKRLSVLCAALLGSKVQADGADLLLYLAAARLLTVLLDASQWKCFEPGVLCFHILLHAGRPPASFACIVASLLHLCFCRRTLPTAETLLLTHVAIVYRACGRIPGGVRPCRAPVPSASAPLCSSQADLRADRQQQQQQAASCCKSGSTSAVRPDACTQGSSGPIAHTE